MAKITFTNMIPVDGAYYLTQKLTESERETAQGFTNKPVMADIIASDELTAWSQKATERVFVRYRDIIPATWMSTKECE